MSKEEIKEEIDTKKLKKMEKEKYKMEKKRIKAEKNLAKKQSKPYSPDESRQENRQELPGPVIVHVPIRTHGPWYKNPEWIKAIAAIASLIVAIIAIYIHIQ